MKRKANGSGVPSEPFPTDRLAPSTPPDERIRLPDDERQATRTRLPNGTVLVSYDEAPRETETDLQPALQGNADGSLGELEGNVPTRKDGPKPPTTDRVSKWEGLR